MGVISDESRFHYLTLDRVIQKLVGSWVSKEPVDSSMHPVRDASSRVAIGIHVVLESDQNLN